MIDKNLQQTIQEGLCKKAQANPLYSLRAFARDVGVSPGHMSKILNGQKAPSIEVLLKMADRLNISLDEMPRRRPTRQSPSLKKQQQRVCEAQQLERISDWYYLAILNLVTCEDFKADPQWMAHRLNLPLFTVKRAWSELVEAQLVRESNGQWEKASQHQLWKTTMSHSWIRKYHQQMMDKAKEELQKNTDKDFAARLITGTTLAINPSQLLKAKKKIQKLHKEIVEILTQGKCTEVYQLSSLFFPLSKRRDV